MAARKRKNGAEILEGRRQPKRGKHGRIMELVPGETLAERVSRGQEPAFQRLVADLEREYTAQKIPRL